MRNWMFWDSSKLARMSEEELSRHVERLRELGNQDEVRRLTRRFIERGKGADTLRLFTREETAAALDEIGCSTRSRLFVDPIRIRMYRRYLSWSATDTENVTGRSADADGMTALTVRGIPEAGPDRIRLLIVRTAPEDVLDCHMLYGRNRTLFVMHYIDAMHKEPLLEDLMYVGEKLLWISEAVDRFIQTDPPNRKETDLIQDLISFYSGLGKEIFQAGVSGRPLSTEP